MDGAGETGWRSLDLLIERAGTVLASVTLAVALVTISAQVVARYIVGDSIIWAEELARYALIWSAMIGAAVAYRRGAHVAVGVLWGVLPEAGVRFVWRAIHLIVVAFAAVVLWQGLALVLRNFARHQLSPALQVEIGWAYLAIPCGGALLALAAIEGIWLARRPSK
ncbi:MAG TPA: TRAP transporter small permease [Woeseiaceae bacterium]|nr:TRAP transporter small permease [Woeseiaceae bacterium]